MGIFAKIGIEDTLMINFIDPHFLVGVYNMLIVKQHTHVRYYFFLIIKEQKIARLCLKDQVNHLALRYLLRCIAQYWKASHMVYQLGKA